MCDVEDGFQILEEGVVYDFYLDAEMVAKGMENASSLHFRRIGCDFIVVILVDFWIDIAAEELFCLFGFDE